MTDFVFTVAQPKVRLDVAIAEQYPDISRSRIQKDIAAGLVSVNGNLVTENKFSVTSGNEIRYAYAEAKPVPATGMHIPILFENDDILIVDKPPGLPVHPAPGYAGTTLIGELLALYPELRSVGEDPLRPGIVHRLDKDTSGAMLVAKTQRAFDHLKDAFALRRVKKEYLALVCGRLDQKHGVLDDPIGRHPTDFRKMATSASKEPPKDLKAAITEFFTEGYYAGQGPAVDEYTLIRVKLHTGRTHQIRVHLAALGFPIVGDPLYGKPQCRIPEVTRQFLHARCIEVQLPDGTWIEAKSELAPDLQSALDALRKLPS